MHLHEFLLKEFSIEAFIRHQQYSTISDNFREK